MSLNCPRCGGDASRQLNDGLMRCISRVQVGQQDVPPEVTRAGHHVLPIFGECGHVFRIGRTNGSCSCCGRSPLGHCEDCGDPICHIHGTSSGTFLCPTCVHGRRRAAELERNRNDAEARHAVERAANQIRAQAFTVDEAVGLFEAALDALRTDEVAQAWAYLVQQEDMPGADDELIDVQFVGRWFSSGATAHGLKRTTVWLSTVRGEDFWVDRHGRIWREVPNDRTVEQNATFAIFAGAEPIPSVRQGSHGLTNGDLVVPVDDDDEIVPAVIISAVRIATEWADGD